MNHENYSKEIEILKEELLKKKTDFINVSELAERLIQLDNEYNNESWNLLQILTNIKLSIPVEERKMTSNDRSLNYVYYLEDEDFHEYVEKFRIQNKMSIKQACNQLIVTLVRESYSK